jgi:hypothetical protein
MQNENFLEQLILKANPDLDDTGIEMMVSDAKPVLQERVFTNIMAKLNPDQRKQLINLTENKNYVS